MNSYVEDELALYVPANEHGLPLLLHNVDVGVLTQRSLLPVSICNRKLCAGVPSVTLAKYNVSCRPSAPVPCYTKTLQHTSLSNVA
jgi:hypothetical protein